MIFTNKILKQKGFTMIEILVVIAIIGILASVTFVVISPKDKLDNAEEKKLRYEFAQAPQSAMMEGATLGDYTNIAVNSKTKNFLEAADSTVIIRSDHNSGFAVSGKLLKSGKYLCVDKKGVREVSAEEREMMLQVNSNYSCSITAEEYLESLALAKYVGNQNIKPEGLTLSITRTGSTSGWTANGFYTRLSPQPPSGVIRTGFHFPSQSFTTFIKVTNIPHYKTGCSGISMTGNIACPRYGRPDLSTGLHVVRGTGSRIEIIARGRNGSHTSKYGSEEIIMNAFRVYKGSLTAEQESMVRNEMGS